MNINELTNVVEALQTQLTQAQSNIATLQNDLGIAKNAYDEAKVEIYRLQGQIKDKPSGKTKLRKPVSFHGKGSESILSWTTHMDNYLDTIPGSEALNIAVSYLDGNAHEWWIAYSQTIEGKNIAVWNQLKEALIDRFQSLNKEKAARDKLAKWKQVKDVLQFNHDFQRIVIDIPDISTSEQIDRYTRGLKPYIWKEMCTKDYENLTDAMRDAERIEAAHRRLKNIAPARKSPMINEGRAPMDIGNLELKKLTPAEREKCMKEGRCLRCREKGHLAKNCPKGRGN